MEIRKEIKFNITLEDGQAINNVQKLSKRSEINEKMKLYFELGYKKDIELGIDNGNWVRTGKFQEVINPVEYRDSDSRLEDPEYIAHHNFVFNYG